MEAKDTVIEKYRSDDGSIADISDHCGIVYEMVANQAEISFKAGEGMGYERGLHEQGSPRADLENELVDEEFRKQYHIARLSIDMEFYKAGYKQALKDRNLVD